MKTGASVTTVRGLPKRRVEQLTQETGEKSVSSFIENWAWWWRKLDDYFNACSAAANGFNLDNPPEGLRVFACRDLMSVFNLGKARQGGFLEVYLEKLVDMEFEARLSQDEQWLPAIMKGKLNLSWETDEYELPSYVKRLPWSKAKDHFKEVWEKAHEPFKQGPRGKGPGKYQKARTDALELIDIYTLLDEGRRVEVSQEQLNRANKQIRRVGAND